MDPQDLIAQLLSSQGNAQIPDAAGVLGAANPIIQQMEATAQRSREPQGETVDQFIKRTAGADRSRPASVF